MTLDELRAVDARNEGRPDNALGLTFKARAARGLGVRPMVLDDTAPDGLKVYGLTVKQVRRLLRLAEERA